MALVDFRSICLPYCLQRMHDGGYVALNREYAPIGFNDKAWYDYEAFPISTHYDGLTAKKAAQIAYNGDSRLDCIKLYNDGCVPTRNAAAMAAYLQRLERLARLKRGRS